MQGAADHVSLEPLDESDLTQWAVTLTPEKGSLYEGGKFKLSATVGDRYPIQPPTFSFITPVCHPNVHATTGEICLDVLKDECVAPDAHSLTALTHCPHSRHSLTALTYCTHSLHSTTVHIITPDAHSLTALVLHRTHNISVSARRMFYFILFFNVFLHTSCTLTHVCSLH